MSLAGLLLSVALLASPLSVPFANTAARPAEAHTQQNCYPETIWRIVWTPPSYQPFVVTRCDNVPHSHFWQEALIWGTGYAFCASLSYAVGAATAVVGGLAAGAACGGILFVTEQLRN